MHALEWNDESTGGGCEARMARRDGVIYCITTDDDPSLPEPGQPVALGIYPNDDAWLTGEALHLATHADEATAKAFAESFDVSAAPVVAPRKFSTDAAEAELVREYEAWNTAQGLNLGSADEHLADDSLTVEQRAWLLDFCNRWDVALSGDVDAK